MIFRPRAVAAGALTALAAAAAVAPLGAQQWRTVEVSRQLRDTTPHEVRIRYGAGSLHVRPADDPVLFAMQLRYDEDAETPVHRYDALARTLTLGVRDAPVRLGRGGNRRSRGELRVALSRALPLNLDVSLGAAEASLDLGGLALRGVRIETGASDAKVSFDRPNGTRLDLLEVNAGAADVGVTGLANANAGAVRIASGIGDVHLSFGGPLSRDVDIVSEIALGRVTVVVPRDAGVRLELSRVVAGFEHFGLVRRGDAYYSENYDRASRRISMRVRTVFGKVAIRRAE